MGWLEMGGVYALANLRGGSEYGKEWYDGGRLKNKQNVFDDFVAAAEYLIREKYSSTPEVRLRQLGGQEGFETLIRYSQLHNTKPGTRYPAVLNTTGDHDDRVVPAHSFKYAATLHAAQAGEAPILIRIETRAGHGAGKPTSNHRGGSGPLHLPGEDLGMRLSPAK